MSLDNQAPATVEALSTPGMPTVGIPGTSANKELRSMEPTATHGRKNPTNPAALARSLPLRPPGLGSAQSWTAA
ncbi:hypothetical protein chiPu_0028701 [Chiloscyllium punctatum]|uniref:Uncharacterized protein n=1 Tax=Chiloscyllium punctatum TaxID=137246 RepID=A0A401TNV2_CHIPU|nr:hypothetical protein [Chiloscyllium punctatum]